MNINLTLIVQMIVFIVLIWFTMKFVWPMILGPMEERSKKIAAGLAAAREGKQDLAPGHDRADAIVREARERAGQIIDQAQHRANDMVEQAKGTATSEGARLVESAKEQIDLETAHAREALRREVATLPSARLEDPGARDQSADARGPDRQAGHANLGLHETWQKRQQSHDRTPKRLSRKPRATSVWSLVRLAAGCRRR